MTQERLVLEITPPDRCANAPQLVRHDYKVQVEVTLASQINSTSILTIPMRPLICRTLNSVWRIPVLVSISSSVATGRLLKDELQSQHITTSCLGQNDILRLLVGTHAASEHLKNAC